MHSQIPKMDTLLSHLKKKIHSTELKQNINDLSKFTSVDVFNISCKFYFYQNSSRPIHSKNVNI